ncbi:MAG: IS66 family insertion sequence element accessory protein TnpA [Polyangiaceae bacterium]
MTVKTTAAEWTERVRAWRESGRSSAEFAEGKGYSEKLLRWWSSELARRARQKPRVQLARVVRTPPTASVPLTVTIGAARIEVRVGFDRALLRDVIDALGGAR